MIACFQTGTKFRERVSKARGIRKNRMEEYSRKRKQDMQTLVAKKGMFEGLKSSVLYLEIGDGRWSSVDTGKSIWHREVDAVASTFDPVSYRKVEEGYLT